MNWEKNLKFISCIMRFISFYKFLVRGEVMGKSQRDKGKRGEQ